MNPADHNPAIHPFNIGIEKVALANVGRILSAYIIKNGINKDVNVTVLKKLRKIAPIFIILILNAVYVVFVIDRKFVTLRFKYGINGNVSVDADFSNSAFPAINGMNNGADVSRANSRDAETTNFSITEPANANADFPKNAGPITFGTIKPVDVSLAKFKFVVPTKYGIRKRVHAIA